MAGKRSVLTCCALLLLLVRVNASTGSDHSPPGNQTKDHEEVPELKVAKVDYHHVSGPFTIMVWILIASLAKLGESVLLLLVSRNFVLMYFFVGAVNTL